MSNRAPATRTPIQLSLPNLVFLDERRAAVYIGISLRKLRILHRTGKAPAFVQGKSGPEYSLDELNTYILDSLAISGSPQPLATNERRSL